MGNKPCTIGLSTDRATYAAGSTVSGTIYVSVVGVPQAASSLNLRLVGRESTTVHYTTSETRHADDRDRGHGHGHGHSHDRDRYESANFAFFNVEFPVATFAVGQIQPGQYEFPFRMALPPDLPGSMSCRRGQSHCEISYELTSELKRSGSGGFFSSNPRERQTLIVVASPRTNKADDVGIALPPESIPVRRCCCCGRGYMSLSCQIDKSVLQPGQEVGVEFKAKNDSAARVGSVNLAIEEVVEWSAHGRSEELKRNLACRVLGGPAEMPELRELSKHEARRRRYLGTSGGGYDRLSMDSSIPLRRGALLIRPDSRDTYHGKLVEVRHTFSVTIVTEGCCCVTNPEACVAVTVERSPLEIRSEFASADDPALDVSVACDRPHPSAPPAEHDMYSGCIPEARVVLPEDWSAQTAEVVSIPVAEATVLGKSHGSA